MDANKNDINKELNKLKNAIANLDIIKNINNYPLETLLRYFPERKKDIEQCYEGGRLKEDEVEACQDIISQQLYALLSPYIEKGYTLYSSNIIKTERANEGKDDVCSILECIQPDLKRIMDDILSKGNDMQMLLIPRLIMNDIDGQYESDFRLNWSNLQLTIKNSDPYKTYRFILYINLAYYNSYMLDNITITDQQTLDGQSFKGYPI